MIVTIYVTTWLLLLIFFCFWPLDFYTVCQNKLHLFYSLKYFAKVRSTLIVFGMSIKEFPVACVFHILFKIETSDRRRHVVACMPPPQNRSARRNLLASYSVSIIPLAYNVLYVRECFRWFSLIFEFTTIRLITDLWLWKPFSNAHSHGEYLQYPVLSFIQVKWYRVTRGICWRTTNARTTAGRPIDDHKTWHSPPTIVSGGIQTENQLKRLLSAIRYTAGDFYAFQQDSARSHDARESVAAATRDVRLHHTRVTRPSSGANLNEPFPELHKLALNFLATFFSRHSAEQQPSPSFTRAVFMCMRPLRSPF